MDSKGMHNGSKIAKNLRRYLTEEWRYRKAGGGVDVTQEWTFDKASMPLVDCRNKV